MAMQKQARHFGELMAKTSSVVHGVDGVRNEVMCNGLEMFENGGSLLRWAESEGAGATGLGEVPCEGAHFSEALNIAPVSS